MPNNEMDYSLIHRTPDGNGKILVTTPGSPDKGSWETEAELKTYVNQDVNIAISALNTRVTNIEETLMGENEITVSYPNDGNYPSLMPNKVPLRALKFAEVVNLRGVSRVANQLLPAIASGNGYGGLNYQTNISFNNGVMTLTGDNIVDVKNSNQEFISGHVYLVGVSFNQVTAGITIGTTSNYSAIYSSSSDPTGAWVTKAFIYTATNASRLYFVGRTGIQIKDYILRDLTLYFGGTIPSDADTIAEIQTYYPWLLEPSDYGTSIVDTTVEGVKSVGVNIWDEEWEVGSIDPTTGEDATNPSTIRSKNFIRVVPSTAYYCKAGSLQSQEVAIFYYDINMNFISLVGGGNTSWTTPSNACFVRFFCAIAYGTTYNHDIQICLNSYADKTTYHPYMTDTLSLSEPVTLRSAGSVADELDVESGVVTRKIGGVNFEDLNWAESSSVQKAFYANLSDYKFDSLCQALCSKYPYIGTIHTGTADLANYDKVCALYFNAGVLAREVYIRDTSLASASQINGAFLYELATPTTESIDPIPYNFLEVEGGGTVETIQTQTPIIDNCLDVTYDIIPQ